MITGPQGTWFNDGTPVYQPRIWGDNCFPIECDDNYWDEYFAAMRQAGGAKPPEPKRLVPCDTVIEWSDDLKTWHADGPRRYVRENLGKALSSPIHPSGVKSGELVNFGGIPYRVMFSPDAKIDKECEAIEKEFGNMMTPPATSRVVNVWGTPFRVKSERKIDDRSTMMELERVDMPPEDVIGEPDVIRSEIELNCRIRPRP